MAASADGLGETFNFMRLCNGTLTNVSNSFLLFRLYNVDQQICEFILIATDAYNC